MLHFQQKLIRSIVLMLLTLKYITIRSNKEL